MLKWTSTLLVLGAVAGSLGAMGVGAKALGTLFLVLVLMSGAAMLIAWPFLKRAAPHALESSAAARKQKWQKENDRGA